MEKYVKLLLTTLCVVALLSQVECDREKGVCVDDVRACLEAVTPPDEADPEQTCRAYTEAVNCMLNCPEAELTQAGLEEHYNFLLETLDSLRKDPDISCP